MIETDPGAGAHVAWDVIWAQKDDDNRWTRPEPEVIDLVPVLRERGVRHVLDLGSGIGRHALLLAREGFDVTAFDGSPVGLRRTADRAPDGRPIRCVQGDLREPLPFADEEFDYVVAWNSVYHGLDDSVARSINEVARVIRPGGIYQSTMLSKRDECFGTGVAMTENAFRFPEQDGDSIYPHFYCDASELIALHGAFELLSVRDASHRPGSYHWHAVFERNAGGA